jgi:uncharacterized protein
MFEFDPAKSAANKVKHGIDFVEAQAIWQDEDRIEQAAKSDAEVRQLTVGRLGDLAWCAVYTFRRDVVRLISVRRARDEEVKAYERNKDNRP